MYVLQAHTPQPFRHAFEMWSRRRQVATRRMLASAVAQSQVAVTAEADTVAGEIGRWRWRRRWLYAPEWR